MAAGPEMEAAGTEGRLASDMYIEQCKKKSHLHHIFSLNNILGVHLVEFSVCASAGESPCAACVHCACASACVAGVGSPAPRWLAASQHRSAKANVVSFSRPYLGENQGDCAGASAQSRCFQARAPARRPCVLLQLRCACRAVAGGPHPAAGDALFRQLAQSCNQQDGCGSPPRSWATREHVIRLIWLRQDSTSRNFQLCCPAEGCRHEPPVRTCMQKQCAPADDGFSQTIKSPNLHTPRTLDKI